MKIDEKAYGEVVVLFLKGNLISEPDAKQLRTAVSNLLEQNVCNVVVDIRKVDHMSSTGLGAIMAAMISLRNRGGELCVANATRKTGPLFVTTKLVKVLKLYESVNRAVASFR
ncbi:MAG: STAS domain-containing protein [Bacteroidota bacterium]